VRSLAALAAILAVGALTWRAGAHQHDGRALDVWGYLLACASAAALGWGRRAPLAALAGTVLATSLYLLAGYPYGPVLLCVVWAMYQCAVRCPPRVSAAAGLGAAVVSVAAVASRLAERLDLPALGLVLWAACWLAVPWSLGTVRQVRGIAAERARRELVARAVLEERIRVAREVHDVAGHGFAVVAMQAGVALTVLDEQPEQARESVRAIRTTSVAALDELRGVLDLLAPAEPEPAGSADLTELTGRLPVALRADGLADLPPTVRETAHHVLREALTNALRHGDGAPAEVEVHRENGDLVVRVANGARGGRGLAGMRARVEAAGGTLGFVVTARIPL
jgi:signal transduction histidine kinase